MRSGTLIGPIIIAIGLVVAALAFAVVGALLQTADGSMEARMQSAETEIDRLERSMEVLRQEIADERDAIRRLQEDLALAQSAPPPRATAPAPALPPGEQIIAQDVTDVTDDAREARLEALKETGIIAKDRFNDGISQPRSSIMLEVLGHPRAQQDYTTECKSITNPNLRALLETRQIGPIRVTMLRPALDSLERIVARLKEEEPEIHDALGTAGALCVRLIRGSSRSISNHSWATAIDLKLVGSLDRFADGKTEFGLLPLALIFNDEGWYWGATYGREDSMHFEVGVETLRRWQAEGLL